MLPRESQKLISWYKKNSRDLPWRRQKNPYAIWVSEVMLQQTTVQAVIPYYKKFIKRFQTLSSLANTPLSQVLPYWSGLGYYSRVKNLHKAAQILCKKKAFPRTYTELLKLPGFGPYTARAVSSLAFEEPAGVLDSNVIRLMCRYKNWPYPYWRHSVRKKLQAEVDLWLASPHPPSLMNQALMELGSKICTAQNPACMLCPLQGTCQALKKGQVLNLPLKKRSQKKTLWVFKVLLLIKKPPSLPLKVALCTSHALPVLKNYPFFPGTVLKVKTPPKKYDFSHSITHHVIYVKVYQETFKGSFRSLKKHSLPPSLKIPDLKWLSIQKLKAHNPSSLLRKITKTLKP